MTVLAALLSAAAVAAAPSPFPPDNKCDLPEERQVAACTWDQYQAWDKALNREYKAAMGQISTDLQAHLVKSQRAWIQYRDANCAIRAARQGTSAAYFENQCLLNMTRDRAKELRELPDEVEG